MNIIPMLKRDSGGTGCAMHSQLFLTNKQQIAMSHNSKINCQQFGGQLFCSLINESITGTSSMQSYHFANLLGLIFEKSFSIPKSQTLTFSLFKMIHTQRLNSLQPGRHYPLPWELIFVMTKERNLCTSVGSFDTVTPCHDLFLRSLHLCWSKHVDSNPQTSWHSILHDHRNHQTSDPELRILV